MLLKIAMSVAGLTAKCKGCKGLGKCYYSSQNFKTIRKEINREPEKIVKGQTYGDLTVISDEYPSKLFTDHQCHVQDVKESILCDMMIFEMEDSHVAGKDGRCSMSRKRFLKNQSHRKVRRSKHTFGKGNLSNRLFDYWWALY